MSEQQEFILYDLPSVAPSKSWSANAWKTRYALNYKQLPYKTQWVNYIHLQQTLKDLGLNPNPPDAWAPYTVPVLTFPDTTTIMDSTTIAAALEQSHPTPSLHLNPTLEAQASQAVSEVFLSLIPLLAPLALDIVAPEDVEWWKADRAARFGRSVEDMFRMPEDVSAVYEGARKGFEGWGGLLREHKRDPGPFVLGSRVSYVDFVLVAGLKMWVRMGLDGIWGVAPREVRGLFDACEGWAGKED